MSTATTTLCPHDSAGVLVASPNTVLRKHIVTRLSSRSWPLHEATGGAEALGKLESSECDLLILDENLPDLDAHELSAIIRVQFPGVDIVMLERDSGRAIPPEDFRVGGVAHVLRALGAGGDDSPQRVRNVPGVPNTAEPLPGMIGSSHVMCRLYRLARIVAPRDTAVLLTGDSGSGKELVAQAIHSLSPRATRSFVVINCAAIPEALLESELFGYTRGAFTGAVQSRTGRIHAAHTGTLFLDEIGELPLSLQAKLLRFLECGEVQRLGSPDVFRVDVRVIAATNADLQRRVEKGEFRKDLFFRLSVFPIELPCLSARKSDIRPLAEFFLQKLSGRPVGVSSGAIERLEAHDWPGNVRELRHVMERASILAGEQALILPEHIAILPSDISRLVL